MNSTLSGNIKLLSLVCKSIEKCCKIFWSGCNCSAISLGRYFGLSQYLIFKSRMIHSFICYLQIFLQICSIQPRLLKRRQYDFGRWVKDISKSFEDFFQTTSRFHPLNNLLTKRFWQERDLKKSPNMNLICRTENFEELFYLSNVLERKKFND